MKVLLICLGVFFTISACAQTDGHMALVLKRKGKEKILKNFNDFELLSKTDSSGTTFEVEAYITPSIRLQSDSLSISVCSVAKETMFENSETQVVTTEYPLSMPGTYIVHVNQIDKITVGRNFVKISSGLLGTLSVLSAIAVAPAMYGGPHYNYTRYRQMVGVSLLSAATFLAVNITLGSKTYKLNSENLDKNWQLHAVITQ